MFCQQKITDPNNITIDTTVDAQNPLNIAETDATVTTTGTIVATTSTSLRVGNVTDETMCCSLFGACLYLTGSVQGTMSDLVAVPTPPVVPGMISRIDTKQV